MSATYTLCQLSSGEFQRRRLGADLALNPAPDGFVWVEGEHAPLTSRAIWPTDDFGTLRTEVQPLVLVQTPAPPPETDWVCWTWDVDANNWREVPKLKLLQANARPPLLQVLADLDKKEARPAGEILLAQALGQAVPAAAIERLQAVSADKLTVRARLVEIDAAETIKQLSTLLATPVELQTVQA